VLRELVYVMSAVGKSLSQDSTFTSSNVRCRNNILDTITTFSLAMCSEFSFLTGTALFEKREALKPKKERRKVPVMPTTLPGAGYDSKSLQELNELSASAWASNLDECQWCGRRFLPEKLVIHNRSCRADNPARRASSITSVEKESANIPAASRSDRPGQMEGAMTATGRVSRMSSSAPLTSFVPLEMQQCPDCGRSFNEVAYGKHIVICKNVFMEKRKVFDSAKARAKGTELEEYLGSQRKKKSGRGSDALTQKPSADLHRKEVRASMTVRMDGNVDAKWKQDSLAFRQAIRAARAVSHAEDFAKVNGLSLRDVLPPPIRQQDDPVYSSYIQCPTCNRSFNQKAGERHIPLCKNIIHKPSRLISHSGHVASSLAIPTSPEKPSVAKLNTMSKPSLGDRQVSRLTPRNVDVAAVVPKQINTPRSRGNLMMIDRMPPGKGESRLVESRHSRPSPKYDPSAFGGGITQGSVIAFDEDSRKASVVGRKKSTY